jgi:hypothetical protein
MISFEKWAWSKIKIKNNHNIIDPGNLSQASGLEVNLSTKLSILSHYIPTLLSIVDPVQDSLAMLTYK